LVDNIGQQAETVAAGTSLAPTGGMALLSQSDSTGRMVIRGGFLGALATLAMSSLMLASQRAGFLRKYPPERVVERAAHAAELPIDEETVDVAASVAHVGFGMAGGAVFGLLRPRLPAIPSEAFAVAWALVIWAGSYFGWVPALRIIPSPTEDRPGRAWTMALAHVVYGLALGALWRVTSGTRFGR
jgi:hypothetical protein